MRVIIEKEDGSTISLTRVSAGVVITQVDRTAQTVITLTPEECGRLVSAILEEVEGESGNHN